MCVSFGSDSEDLGVKQEPMDSNKVKSEGFPPRLESDEPYPDSQHVLADAQLQTVAGSGKLYVME